MTGEPPKASVRRFSFEPDQQHFYIEIRAIKVPMDDIKPEHDIKDLEKITKANHPYQNELDTVFPTSQSVVSVYKQFGEKYRSEAERCGKRTVILSDDDAQLMMHVGRDLGQKIMENIGCTNIKQAVVGSIGSMKDAKLDLTFYNWGAFAFFYFPKSEREYVLDLDRPDGLEVETRRHGISRILGKFRRERIEIPKS